MRFLARGFSVPGDHPGQQSHGYRWPYGPVTLITPFNFPLEIPVLQVSRRLWVCRCNCWVCGWRQRPCQHPQKVPVTPKVPLLDACIIREAQAAC